MKSYTEINEWLDEHKDNTNHDEGQRLAQIIHDTTILFMNLFGVDVKTGVKEGGLFFK